MIELLVAIIIIGITVVAMLGTLTTSITSSSEYRSLATVDTVLKTFAEAIKAEDSAATFYQPCAATYQVVSEYPTSAVVGTGITVFGTDIPAGGVTVDVDGTAVSPTAYIPSGSPTAPASGNISVTFALPPMSAGTHQISLVPSATSVQIPAATSLTVEPSGTAVTSAVANDVVSITSVAWWNNALPANGGQQYVTSASPACLSNPNEDSSGLELLSLKAIGPDGVADTLSTVIANPGTTNPAMDAPAGPSISISSSPSNPTPGELVTFTATLQGGSDGPPTAGTAGAGGTAGGVGWSISGGVVPPTCPNSTTPASSSGNISTWTCAVTLASGNFAVTASYSGDGNYGPAATSTPFNVSVSPFTIPSVALENSSGSPTAAPNQIVQGDSIVITFSAPVNEGSLCPGSTWPTTGLTTFTNQKTIVTVTNSFGPDDVIGISRSNATSANCNTFGTGFGTIDLGSSAYVNGTTTFSGANANATTITWNAAGTVLTITLGTLSGQATTPVPTPTGNPVYNYPTTITDTFGDAITPAPPFALSTGPQF